MQREFSFAPNEFYHLYNRGTDKRTIFNNKQDYSRFVHLLYLCNGTIPIVYKTLPRHDVLSIERGDQLIDIGAYCLMPNHFHILVRERTKQGKGISAFMKKILTAYSMYFNKKYDRTGSLFEGTFKAKHANRDQYLKYLFSYIHLNPAKIIDAYWKTNIRANRKKIFAYVREYRYSSFLDYISVNDPRTELAVLNKDAFPDYFHRKNSAERELIEWLTFPVSKD
ncbi:MAG: transposase [Parcubacteria group bacterium Gr01-1014_17]|nr:MAG: transposase [Parcubacteria group bacterium Gr01-1014_17]